MNLQQFLETVPELTDQEALVAAQAHQTTAGVLLDASTVNSLLAVFGLPVAIDTVLKDPTHIAFSQLWGVKVGLEGNHQFNFKQDSVAGQRQLTALDWLIETGIPEYAEPLTMFKGTVISLSNTVTYPFANVTLYDVMVLRGTCPTKEITIENLWYVVTTTEECPAHNPQISVLNTRTNRWQRVTSLYNVGAPGVYEARIPGEWVGSNLRVDNAYGVL